MSEIRLLKLLPDQVANFWDEIRPALMGSLPPVAAKIDAPDRMNRILAAILSGELEVHTWSRVDTENKSVKLLVLATTAVMKNFESDYKTMLIYSIYAFDRAAIREYKEGFEMLRSYAKSKGCKLLTAYTNVDSIKGLWESLGGEVRFSLLSMEV